MALEQQSSLLQEDVLQKSRGKVWITSVAAATIFLIAVGYLLLSNKSVMVAKSSIKSVITQIIPTPTPIPFYELTIPYLRSRSYQSTLGSLEDVSQNTNYTSYITSYTSDGLKINGLLTKPAGEEPDNGWPAIVFVHGYIPSLTYQTTGQQYADYVDYLADNGFVVFKIDLRGHGSSEGEPGGSYYSSDYIIDVLNAYAALTHTPFVNAEKIGLWGHSMAGNVIARSMAVKPDIPAIVVWAGAVYSYKDFADYGINDNSYQPPQTSSERQRKRQELMTTYGQPKDGNPFWQQVAATSFLKDIKGAIQLNHAVNDEVVNVGYSRDFNALLDKTSVPHELHEYLNGGHNLTGSSFVAAMQNTVAFFKKYLQ